MYIHSNIGINGLRKGTKLLIWSDKELKEDFFDFVNKNRMTKCQIDCLLDQLIAELVIYGN